MIMIKKTTFSIAIAIVLALIMQILFVSMREVDEYRADQQVIAKIDAAYYNSLIIKNINTIDDVKVNTPNLESTSFLLLLFIQKKMGIEDESVRSFFNIIILTTIIFILFSKINIKITTSILFQFALAPLIIYVSLTSKETFILFGLITLMIGYVSRRGIRAVLWIILGLILLILSRPILGLLVIVSLMITYMIIKRKIRGVLIIATVGIPSFFIFFNQIVDIGNIYQQANLEYQNVSCQQFGFDVCFNGDGGGGDILKFAYRSLIWAFFRFGKGAVDLVLNFSGNSEVFEMYINISYTLAALSVIIAFINRKKINININQNICFKIYIFSIALLILLILVGGGVAYFQTQRLYGLIYPLIFLIIATRKSYVMGR